MYAAAYRQMSVANGCYYVLSFHKQTRTKKYGAVRPIKAYSSGKIRFYHYQASSQTPVSSMSISYPLPSWGTCLYISRI